VGQVKLLDTDVLSSLVKRDVPERVHSEVRGMAIVFTSAVNLAEILHGLERLGSPAMRELYESRVFPYLVVLPFDESAAHRYGRLRATLEAQG
jgi:predicted nucleic acid-binding protein